MSEVTGTMTTAAESVTSDLLCHCLGITRQQIREVAHLSDDALRDVMSCTGAGTGCTACHRRIRAFLQQVAAEQAKEPASTADFQPSRQPW